MSAVGRTIRRAATVLMRSAAPLKCRLVAFAAVWNRSTRRPVFPNWTLPCASVRERGEASKNLGDCMINRLKNVCFLCALQNASEVVL